MLNQHTPDFLSMKIYFIGDYKNMNVLITGSSGFIGFHLSKDLLDRGDAVFGIDSMNDYYDVNLKESRLKYLKKYKNFQFEKLNLTDKDSLAKVLKDLNQIGS